MEPSRLKGLVCYIAAMVFKGFPVFAVVLLSLQIPAPVAAQAVSGQPTAGQGSAAHPAPAPQAPAISASPSGAQQGSTNPTVNSPAAKGDCDGFPCDMPQPRITVANPPPVQSAWPLRDRITWGATLVLAVMGYVGIMLALSLLRKIERQTRIAEASVVAAEQSAQAAFKNAQAALNHSEAVLAGARANLDAGRSWLLVSIEPSPDAENAFSVLATNRGRSPARIVGTTEQIMFAVDEANLPGTPEYANPEPAAPVIPIILLAGESAEIKPFGRDDLRGICESDELLGRVERWEERVYLYGKVFYRDLTAPADKPPYETAWCCWYIHGRQKSGLVFAGSAEYNSHT